MKYCVINSPKGIRVEATRGRREGLELKDGGIVTWNYFESRQRAEEAAQSLRQTQRRVEGKASGE
jgi:hypothetical protein